jgi:hypothetical protein
MERKARYHPSPILLINMSSRAFLRTAVEGLFLSFR